jgi:enamine deaminase RidA (YjgF/YER057c/UK114 family)
MPAPSSPRNPKLQHLQKPGADITLINREHLRELHITLRPLANERTAMMLWRLEAVLREHDATIVRAEIFGAVSALDETASRLRKLLREPELPITCVEGTGVESQQPISGIHIFAVAGTEVEPLLVKGKAVGRIFQDGHARHLLLGDITPANVKGSRADQTRSVYERMEEYGAAAGMKITQLTRTWMFLDDILDWYGLLNSVRTEFYQTRKIFDTLVPASTGVGVKNAHGAALVAGAWLLQPTNDTMLVRELGSPLQCPAPKYGSSFARALEYLTPEYRRVLISGTASIHRDGETARVGDIRGQIELTMDVIQAILAANDLTYTATTRATAYFKDIRNAHYFDEWRRRNELLRLPVVSVQADVCRDDLLFELELDAMAQVAGPASKGRLGKSSR